MEALVIQHAPDTGIGLVGPILRRKHGFELSTVDATTVDFDRLDTCDTELVVILGSPRGVYERHVPWIASELRFTRRLLERRKPVFGICFGGQMLAAALGAEVRPMGVRHRGWMTNDVAIDDVWAGPWFRWHGDTFALPPGADRLASDGEVTQAFQKGSAVGVQFHPEVDDGMIRAWSNDTASDTGGEPERPPGDLFKSGAAMQDVERRLDLLIADVLRRCLRSHEGRRPA